MFRKRRRVMGMLSMEWVRKFREDMVAASLMEEEIAFQLKDPYFMRPGIMCRGITKERFAELWNSSVRKIFDAGLDYRVDYVMEVRGDEVYKTQHCNDGSELTVLALEKDYDPFEC